MTDIDKLETLALSVMETLAEEAVTLARKERKSVQSCVARLFRPYLMATDAPEGVEAVIDKREQDWWVKTTWYDVTDGEEAHADLLAESDFEKVTGFSAVIRLVREYYDGVHGKEYAPVPEFSPSRLQTKLRALRPCISRSNDGRAAMRLRYRVGYTDFLCVAIVSRVEIK